VWNTHLQLHYTLYRALWHGRSGDDGNAKAVLKQVYVLVDQAADGGLFRQLRRRGGLLAVSRRIHHALMTDPFRRKSVPISAGHASEYNILDDLFGLVG